MYGHSVFKWNIRFLDLLDSFLKIACTHRYSQLKAWTLHAWYMHAFSVESLFLLFMPMQFKMFASFFSLFWFICPIAKQNSLICSVQIKFGNRTHRSVTIVKWGWAYVGCLVWHAMFNARCGDWCFYVQKRCMPTSEFSVLLPNVLCFPSHSSDDYFALAIIPCNWVRHTVGFVNRKRQNSSVNVKEWDVWAPGET